MKRGAHSHANYTWKIKNGDLPGSAANVHEATLATLMDIREELRGVTHRLDCLETLSIPRLLRELVAATRKKRKPKLRVVNRRAA